MLPGISEADLRLIVERSRTWDALEPKLLDLLTRGIVLEFERDPDGKTRVTLNGVTRPFVFRVPDQAPPKNDPPPPSEVVEKKSFEKPSAPKRPRKKTKKKARALKSEKTANRNSASGGVVVTAFGSRVETEDYEEHLRRFARFCDGRDDMAEFCVDDWIGSLKNGDN